MDEMRLRLVERAAAKGAKDDLAQIQRQEPPSFWKAVARYEQAVAAAGSAADQRGGDVAGTRAAAHRRLTTDSRQGTTTERK